MMKLFSRLMLVLALGVTSPAYASQDGEVTLKLIETSDVHGCYFSYDFTSMKPRKGGLACVSSFVKEQREQYGDGVVIMGIFYKDSPLLIITITSIQLLFM